MVRRNVLASLFPGRRVVYLSASETIVAACQYSRNHSEEQTRRAKGGQGRGVVGQVSSPPQCSFPQFSIPLSRTVSLILLRDRRRSIIFISVPFKHLLYV